MTQVLYLNSMLCESSMPNTFVMKSLGLSSQSLPYIFRERYQRFFFLFYQPVASSHQIFGKILRYSSPWKETSSFTLLQLHIQVLTSKITKMIIFGMPPFLLTLLGLYYWCLFKGVTVVILFIQEILAPDVANAVVEKPSRSEPGEGHDTGLILHGNTPSIEEIPRKLVGMETQGGCYTPHSE